MQYFAKIEQVQRLIKDIMDPNSLYYDMYEPYIDGSFVRQWEKEVSDGYLFH